MSGAVSIDGLEGFDNEHRDCIGFVHHKGGNKNHVYLFPDTTFEKVKAMSRDEQLGGTRRAIARQLKDLGAIIDCTVSKAGSEVMTKVVRYKNSRPSVWVMSADKLGIVPGLSVVEEPPKQYRPLVEDKNIKLDEDGLV